MIKIFNINAAKSGAKVITRDKRPVKIVDFSIKRGLFKIVAVIPSNDTREDGVYLFTEEGKFYPNGQQSENDLFIEEEPKYRPYNPMEEMDEAVMKHGIVVVNLQGRRYTMYGYSDTLVYIGHENVSYNRFLEAYTWLDGTPCGIMEGGKDE